MGSKCLAIEPGWLKDPGEAVAHGDWRIGFQGFDSGDSFFGGCAGFGHDKVVGLGCLDKEGPGITQVEKAFAQRAGVEELFESADYNHVGFYRLVDASAIGSYGDVLGARVECVVADYHRSADQLFAVAAIDGLIEVGVGRVAGGHRAFVSFAVVFLGRLARGNKNSEGEGRQENYGMEWCPFHFFWKLESVR